MLQLHFDIIQLKKFFVHESFEERKRLVNFGILQFADHLNSSNTLDQSNRLLANHELKVALVKCDVVKKVDQWLGGASWRHAQQYPHYQHALILLL